jgi:prepilin peptidase CpaA
MALGDLKTRRIPNYLTLGAALAGLGYQVGTHGWAGLQAGLGGLLVGFGLLIGFYLLGGMGAGDVKALAALGTWLGPTQTFMLFIYMGLWGGLMVLGYLWWQGCLWQKLRHLGVTMINRILARPPALQTDGTVAVQTEGIPYAVAMAAGMLCLCWRLSGS